MANADEFVTDDFFEALAAVRRTTADIENLRGRPPASLLREAIEDQERMNRLLTRQAEAWRHYELVRDRQFFSGAPRAKAATEE